MRSKWSAVLPVLAIAVVTAVSGGGRTESVAADTLAPCEVHYDCEQGEFCYKGTCVRDAHQEVYHCGKPGCPPGHWCLTPDNEKSRCGEDPSYHCDSACDCGPAHCCNDGLCVKDVDDPWLPGGIEVGPSCFQGVDATYCSSNPECFMGYSSWRGVQALDDFRCYNPIEQEVRGFCGGSDCHFVGDCLSGQVCADLRSDVSEQADPGGLTSPDGGGCVSNATAEAILGWGPPDLLASCDAITTVGRSCEAGWRPGERYLIERVVGESGSCGNGTCEFLLGETSANCSADCACGDGSCDTSEVGSCTVDCGVCDATGCEQPVVPAEWATLSACGDGVCQRDGAVPEDCENCWLDCDAVTDSDGDGTPDGCDSCPLDVGKTEPGICGCGVPDDDLDGDGVLGCHDNCPVVANPGQADFDGDGTGDACDLDIDGDSVDNDADLCPATTLDDPPDRIKKNRYYAESSARFVDANGDWSGVNVTDTFGCDEDQIIDLGGLGIGHERFGITKSALLDFVEQRG